MNKMYDDIEYLDAEYSEHYSDDDFWEKIKNALKDAGKAVIYNALQLYYVMTESDCPLHIKAAIVAALGYFIFPIDVIPDAIPGVGYSDDLSVICAVLLTVQDYIDDNVKEKARETLDSFFGAGTSDGLD